VADNILLACSVLGTVTGLVTAFIAWDKWQQEKRYREPLERVDNSSNPALLADVERRRKILLANAQRRRKMWWGLTGIAAAVAVGAFLGWRVNQPRSVEIPATKAWTDTGVDCAAGSVFEIAATGTITHGSDGNAVGPDGNPDRKKRRANVKGLRDVNHAALIGSIDGQPPYFPVREKTTYTCHAVGRLFLGINDIDVDNNGGKFVARINERTIAG
jgi:hypothetical protein